VQAGARCDAHGGAHDGSRDDVHGDVHDAYPETRQNHEKEQASLPER
jgi:hypothetical protein